MGLLQQFLLSWLVILLFLTGCGEERKEEFGGDETSNETDTFKITETQPADHASGVTIGVAPLVIFNETIDPDSIYTGSIQLTHSALFIQGTIQIDDNTLTYLPSQSLEYDSEYQLTVVSGIRDNRGRTLENTTRCTFTTESLPDLVAPEVNSVSPADNASGVSVDTVIQAVFSESILSSSISTASFSVTDNFSATVNGSFSVEGSTVIFTPGDNLSHFRDFQVTLGTGITDLSGNPLPAENTWSFQTVGGVVINTADAEGMILLSGGLFQMGAVNESPSDNDTSSNEFPVHSVTLTGPFYISEHEVTASEFKGCVDAGACSYTYTTTSDKWTYNQSGKENHPMNYISWNEAGEFATWMTANSSLTYRLCTEAEWEYAARAGTTTKWSCGDSGCLTGVAWYDSNSREGPKEVKTKQANPWGLYDVHGNVWEWTADYYSGSTYTDDADGVTNPTGPASANSRVVRGGAYSSETKSLRSAKRWYKSPDSHAGTVGFRLCADP